MANLKVKEKIRVTKEEIVKKLRKAAAAIDKATDDEIEKIAWDKAFDIIENLTATTRTPIDDVVLLPTIKIFRKRYNIPEYGN